MLHGDGTNGNIFKFQTAKIRHLLRLQYQFVFVDGPVRARAGPGVVPFFRGWGPFRRWVRDNISGTKEERKKRFEDDQTAAAEALEKTLREFDAKVVGVMGFSIGGGVAAALLQRTQQTKPGNEGCHERAKAWCDLEFGVFLMGVPPARDADEFDDNLPKIRLPTVQVYGLRDPWLEKSRVLLKDYSEGSIEDHLTLEFDVGHEINFTDEQHKSIVDAILNAAERGKKLKDSTSNSVTNGEILQD